MTTALLVIAFLACPLMCIGPALLVRRPRDQTRVTSPAPTATRVGPGAMPAGGVDDATSGDVAEVQPRRRRHCC